MFTLVCSLLLVASSPEGGEASPVAAATPPAVDVAPAASVVDATAATVPAPASPAPAPSSPSPTASPASPTASPAPSPSSTATRSPGPAEAPQPEVVSSATAAATPPSLRAIGVGLASTGAAVAVLGTVGFVLAEGLTRPDDPSAERDDAIETFTQSGGFVAVAVASVSAVLVLSGGGLVLADVVDNTADAVAPGVPVDRAQGG